MSRHRSASVVPQQMFFVRSVTLGDWHSFFFSFSLTPSLKRLIILGYIYIYTIIINIFFSHFFFCVWNGMAQNEKQRREEKKNENTCTPRQNNKKKYKNKIILEFKRSLSLSLSLSLSSNAFFSPTKSVLTSFMIRSGALKKRADEKSVLTEV